MSATRLAIATLAGVAAVGAQADELVGFDGSRIVGTWVSTQDGRHVFDSALLGRIEVPVARARVERTASTVMSAQAPAASRWSADVSAKLGMDRGSLKTADDDLDTTLRLVRTTPRGEWLASIDYSYRRTDGVRKDDDITASLGYDRLRTARTFVAGRVYGTTELTQDGSFDATQTASLAAGWRWWEAREQYIRIGPAVGYVAIDRGDGHFDGGALGLYARGKGPLLGKVTFNAELQVLDTLGKGRYADLALQLRHPLGEHLYLALAWDYVWSDFDIETGVSSEWHWVLGWKSRP